MPRITQEEQREWASRFGGASAARLEAKASRSAPREDREHEEQAALISWAEHAAHALPELALLFAIPNGGARSKKTAGRLKAEGVKPGVPDLLLPVARHGFKGLFVEMKAEGGRVAPEQRQWHAKLRAEGYRVAVCFGWVDAKAEILAYLEDAR